MLRMSFPSEINDVPPGRCMLDLAVVRLSMFVEEVEREAEPMIEPL